MAQKPFWTGQNVIPKWFFLGLFLMGGYLYWTLVGHIEKCCTAMFMRISGLKSVDGCQEIKPFLKPPWGPALHIANTGSALYSSSHTVALLWGIVCVLFIVLHCSVLCCIILHLHCVAFHCISYCIALHCTSQILYLAPWIGLHYKQGTIEGPFESCSNKCIGTKSKGWAKHDLARGGLPS